MKTPLREYLDQQRGRASRLADELGVKPSAISQWNQVPPKHVLEVERITGISRHDLRPDLYGPAPVTQQQACA